LGFFSPEDREGVVVDYRESVEAVYERAAVSILKRDRPLKILSAVRAVDDRHGSSLSPPSWVPDWSSDPVLTSLGLSNMFLEPYDAGGSVACGLRIATDARLRCLGISFDVIETLGQTCPMNALKVEKKILPILNQWCQMVSLNQL
jgi:hypothetical protein